MIALVITIIVLLILAGVSLSLITGENGILGRATKAVVQTDIAETRELIEIELMGRSDDENNSYQNQDVIEAVKKVTDKEVTVKEETVESKKGNEVYIGDLWKVNRVFTFKEPEDDSKREFWLRYWSGSYEFGEQETWEQYIKRTNSDQSIVSRRFMGYGHLGRPGEKRCGSNICIMGIFSWLTRS